VTALGVAAAVAVAVRVAVTVRVAVCVAVAVAVAVWLGDGVALGSVVAVELVVAVAVAMAITVRVAVGVARGRLGSPAPAPAAALTGCASGPQRTASATNAPHTTAPYLIRSPTSSGLLARFDLARRMIVHLGLGTVSVELRTCWRTPAGWEAARTFRRTCLFGLPPSSADRRTMAVLRPVTPPHGPSLAK
jgi:hypothetical protein